MADLNNGIRNINKEEEYNSAMQAMARMINLNPEEEEAQKRFEILFSNAENRLMTVRGYKDADEKLEECYKLKDSFNNNFVFAKAISSMNLKTVQGYVDAIILFNKIPDWKNSRQLIAVCRQQINEIEKNSLNTKTEETFYAPLQNPKKSNKTVAIISATVIGILLVIAVFVLVFSNLKEKAGTDTSENREITSTDSKDGTGTSTEREKAETASVTGNADDNGETTTAESNYLLSIDNPEIGDTVTFGTYEQDNDESNGQEDIEWIVLDKNDDNVLLISKYALDYKDYNASKPNESWENCSVGKWLENNFMDLAFTKKEEISIDYTNAIGYVYLLSESEASEYLTEELRICRATQYAEAQCDSKCGSGLYDDGTCEWLLRSSCSVDGIDTVAYADGKGKVYHIAQTVNKWQKFVRPAMRVSY